MIKQTFFAVLAATAIVSQAHASESVVLTPGQKITVQIAADGTVTASSREAAGEPNSFEKYAAAQMAGIPVPEGATTVAPVEARFEEGMAPEIPPRQLRLTFRLIRGKTPHDLVLMLENGYSGMVRYRAKISREGVSGPTDVCTVRPDMFGFEHWPYPITRIELSDFKLEAAAQGQAITCE